MLMHTPTFFRWATFYMLAYIMGVVSPNVWLGLFALVLVISFATWEGNKEAKRLLNET